MPRGFGSARNTDHTSPKPVDTVSELDALCRRPIGISEDRLSSWETRSWPDFADSVVVWFLFSRRFGFKLGDRGRSRHGRNGRRRRRDGWPGWSRLHFLGHAHPGWVSLPPAFICLRRLSLRLGNRPTPDRVPVTNLPRLGKGIGGKGMAAFLQEVVRSAPLSGRTRSDRVISSTSSGQASLRIPH